MFRILLVLCDLYLLLISTGTEDDSYYTGRKLQSTDAGNSSISHKGAAWEQCDFEKANYRYVFLLPYIFLIFSLFIGNIHTKQYYS